MYNPDPKFIPIQLKKLTVPIKKEKKETEKKKTKDRKQKKGTEKTKQKKSPKEESCRVEVAIKEGGARRASGLEEHPQKL